MEEREKIRITSNNSLLGTVVVEVTRRGPYQKIWQAVVVGRSVRSEMFEEDVPKVGHHYYWAQGAMAGEFSKNPRWEDVPPHPVCPVCGDGSHIGYSYDGLECSCWSRDNSGEIVTCWSGEPHQLVEGAGNPWVKAISHPGYA